MENILKKSYFIRKVELELLNLFKQGKIAGTVHTCIGQEYTGAIIGQYFLDGDFLVSNHRGHGHYLSVTGDLDGLIAELMGKENGASKGIGGSQHLINKGFLSNGIQGGMLPIAAGYALANNLYKNRNISFAFLGDGTLGEGIVYETLNLCGIWNVPIIFILENNGIAQSTSIKQSFSGNLKNRIEGFGVRYYDASIYDLEALNKTIEEGVNHAREQQLPVFINIEVARLNSHSKGDDNRSYEIVKELTEKDPLNIYLHSNTAVKTEWDEDFDAKLKRSVGKAEMSSTINLSEIKAFCKTKSNFESNHFIKVDDPVNTKRYNELIYDLLDKEFTHNSHSILIGEDIETANQFNPNEYGGAFKVTKDLSLKFPTRVRNTPISEQAITGFAIGLSLNGFTSFVEIMFGDFTTLSLDQLLQHASKIKCMYGKDVKIPMILRTPMGGYRGYGPTHSQSLEKHFLGIPGLKVLALNQLVLPQDIYAMAIKENSPVLMIENKTLYTLTFLQNIPRGYQRKINLKKYPVVRLNPIHDESSCTIVSYGGVVNEILLALEDLFVIHEIFCDLFVVSDLSEINIPGLSDSLKLTNKLIVVEEGSSYAAYGTELVASLLEQNINDFSLNRISNNFIIPSSRVLEQEVLPTKNKIVSIISKISHN